MAYAIQVSTNLGSWTSVYTNQTGGKVVWQDPAVASSNRRFYRTVVLSATPSDSHGWTPASDWLQALTSPMYYTTTNAGQSAHFYRVQVRP
jgi:hypothetical protein